MKKTYYSKWLPLIGAILIIALALGIYRANTDLMFSTLVIAFVTLVRTLRNFSIIILTDEKFIVKGLNFKHELDWKKIKQVRNDYPRLVISGYTLAEEEALFEQIKEGQDIDGQDYYVLEVKKLIRTKDLIQTIIKKSTNAKIDEGISKLFKLSK